ncbi:MAG: alpha-N-acetylglucosaminidase C-terminal domain-containing protein [Deltaproteobacteria bacterium]|nr:alpha-N-acetylglucosaminidase C-terminal domain-containing protein [Deltaproteobacteria bacterium]
MDWAAKHRFNLLSSNFDFTATWRRVWKKFGVEVPPTSLTAPPFHPWAGWHQWDIKPPYPEDFQEFIADLIKNFVDYGRKLGMKMAPDYRGFLGQVPKEFYEAYRDKARFIDVRWGDLATGKFINPIDPLYKEVWKAYLEEYIKRYGTDHIYACQTLSEMEACETPEEQKEIDISHAKSALEIIRTVDPQGTFFTLDWTWLNKKLWQKENVKAYLDTFPEDTIVVWGLCADRGHQWQLYKELDYYFGKPWLLGFLVAYGGTTMLHGDLAETIKLVQQVAADPKAENCLGISVQPEALRHNYLHFDLLSRLGWKPSGIELESFLEDYAIRRYGKESAQKMVECLKELVSSVYGDTWLTCPLYMFRITNEHMRSGNPYGIHQSKKFLPHLQKALQIALEESDRLGDSLFYQHDIIDIARQFLSDLFNLHVARLAMAFRAQDREAFEREASVLLDILTSQEMLLSSSDYFCLQPIIDKAMALPNAPKDYEQRIRDILTVWADKILDYAHKDYYELVRFYYHPRVDAFIEYLREKLANGSREIKDEELTPLYHKIEQAWVKKPFKVEKSEKYAGTPVEAATQLLRKHRIGEEELKKIEAME